MLLPQAESREFVAATGLQIEIPLRFAVYRPHSSFFRVIDSSDGDSHPSEVSQETVTHESAESLKPRQIVSFFVRGATRKNEQ